MYVLHGEILRLTLVTDPKAVIVEVVGSICTTPKAMQKSVIAGTWTADFKVRPGQVTVGYKIDNKPPISEPSAEGHLPFQRGQIGIIKIPDNSR